MLSPSGRAILLIMPELFCVFPFQIHCQPERCTTGDAYQQVSRIKTWQRIGKCLCNQSIKYNALYFLRRIGTHRQSPHLSQIGSSQSQNNIGNVQDQLLFYLFHIHRTFSFFFSATFLGIAATISLNFFSFSRTLGRSFDPFFTCLSA